MQQVPLSHQPSVFSLLKVIYRFVCVCLMFTCDQPWVESKNQLHKVVSYWPRTYQSGWLMTFRDCYNYSLPCPAFYFPWVLGIKVRSSCLQGKQFTKWNTSSAWIYDFNIKTTFLCSKCPYLLESVGFFFLYDQITLKELLISNTHSTNVV